MKTLHPKPYYFIAPGDELINDYKATIEVAVGSGKKGLVVEVTPEVVNLMDVSGPQGLVLALQHFPQHIEQMLFSLRFAFRFQEDMEQLMPDLQWKSEKKYHRWLSGLRTMPLIPFFVHDREVRLYILAGDYALKDTWAALRHPDADPNDRIMIRGGAMKELTKRLSESCYQFMMYCHGSGFNPKLVIEAMIAQYSLPVHYADIYNRYQKEMKNGGTLRKSDSNSGRKAA